MARKQDATPPGADMQLVAYRNFTRSRTRGIRVAFSLAHLIAPYHHLTRGSSMLGSLENDSGVSRGTLARTQSLGAR